MAESTELASKRCVPCHGGTPPLTEEELRGCLAQLHPGWRVVDGRAIEREIVMRDFRRALEFFQALGEIAEAEGHHPDLCLRRYNHVTVTLWTHAIGGVSENDCILAAKVDRLLQGGRYARGG